MTDEAVTAADGQPLPGTTRNFTQFLQSLDEGAIHTELSELLPIISAALTNHVLEYGGVPKAKLAINIGFKLDKGVFEIVAKVDHKLPEKPSGRTVLWADGQNNFTLANPKQFQMFGQRGPVVIDQTPQDVRTTSSAT